MSRNKARLLAMQSLFQLDTGLDGIRRVTESGLGEEDYSSRDIEYLNLVIQSVIDNQQEIDDYIKKYSIDWDLNRLGKVERSILRLAIGEMIYAGDVPVSVAINEAVRLAKKYGADNAAKFINGILGKFSREELGQEAQAEAADDPDTPEPAEPEDTGDAD